MRTSTKIIVTCWNASETKEVCLCCLSELSSAFGLISVGSVKSFVSADTVVSDTEYASVGAEYSCSAGLLP